MKNFQSVADQKKFFFCKIQLKWITINIAICISKHSPFLHLTSHQRVTVCRLAAAQGLHLGGHHFRERQQGRWGRDGEVTILLMGWTANTAPLKSQHLKEVSVRKGQGRYDQFWLKEAIRTKKTLLSLSFLEFNCSGSLGTLNLHVATFLSPAGKPPSFSA